MRNDPSAQLDDSVLEMIEHSPVGAVPNTPAFQDALNRLRASHRVYADADHRDGNVTARSLAARPAFHAANLEALVCGAIAAEALESNASIFDRYVQALPAALHARAEGFRIKVVGRPVHHRAKHAGGERLPVAHDLPHTIFLVPGAGPHPGLPGNYLHGSVAQAGPDGAPGSWVLHIHDNDDGAAICEFPVMKEALARLQDVLGSAPFDMNELEALGFRLV